MKKYTLHRTYFKGDTFSPSFVFTAKNQEEADTKVFNWTQYHSLDHDSTKAVESVGIELNWEIHNGYIN